MLVWCADCQISSTLVEKIFDHLPYVDLTVHSIEYILIRI